MSDLASNLDLIPTGVAQPDVPANALFNAASWAMGFAKRSNAGLTWGFYGMRIAGTVVANGTVLLTASQTNYVVAHLTTFAVTAATTNTNWNNTAVYGRMYIVTTNASGMTNEEDWRYATGGILISGAVGGGGAGTVTSVALTVPAEFSVSGSPITTTGTLAVTKATQSANLVFAGPTTGGAAAPAFRALVAADLPAFKAPIGIACSDEATAITTGTAVVTFRMPYAMTLTAVRASLSVVSSSGTPTVDIKENGTTILSTLITIDASEKTSTTAATPAVISDPNLADDSEITIDITVAGTGAKGLKVWLIP